MDQIRCQLYRIDQILVDCPFEESIAGFRLEGYIQIADLYSLMLFTIKHRYIT